jgi:hypothetical protein
MRPSAIALALLLISCSSRSAGPRQVTSIHPALDAVAQGVWSVRDRGTVSADDHVRLVYDADGSRVLVVSARPNRGVYAWDGDDWDYIAAPVNQLYMQGAAYDAKREQVVLFGGLEADHTAAESSNKTWSFDGASWRELARGRGPAAGGGATLVYDAAREQVVLTGGGAYTNAKPRAETWLFDGTAWTNAMKPDSPASQYAGAAYDRARERVVLVRPVDSKSSETWEWDGDAWNRSEAATPLPYAYQYFLAYDAGRKQVVSLVAGALWAWDASTWERVDSDDGHESERGTSPIEYDLARQRLVALRPRKSTWEHYGSAWREIPASKPVARNNAASVYDSKHKRIVYFGSAQDANDATWTWDSNSWSRGPSAPSATPTGLQLAYDSQRERAVVVLEGKTWEYDGESWNEVAAAPGNVSSIVYDAARGVSVALIGGATWTWDGTAWHNTMATGPTSARDSAMAFDAARGRVVRFGGYTDGSGSSQIDETWEWDGTRWMRMTPTASPSPRGGHTMAFDSRRERIVLFGGYRHNEVWEYDGQGWLQRRTRTTPEGSFSNGMVYDPERDRMVLFANDGVLWEYYPVGDACTADSQCSSGHCVSGICCDRACGETGCEACSVKQGGSSDGICEPIRDAGAACASKIEDASTDPDGGPRRRQRDSGGCSAARRTSAADGGGWSVVWLLFALGIRVTRRKPHGPLC